jgi:hypothetical protein
MSKIVYGAYGVNGWVSAPPHKHIHVGSPIRARKNLRQMPYWMGGVKMLLERPNIVFQSVLIMNHYRKNRHSRAAIYCHAPPHGKESFIMHDQENARKIIDAR